MKEDKTASKEQRALNTLFGAAQLASMPARDHSIVAESAKVLNEFITKKEDDGK